MIQLVTSSLQNQKVGRGPHHSLYFAGQTKPRGATWLAQSHSSTIRIRTHDPKVQLSALPRTLSAQKFLRGPLCTAHCVA